MARKLLIDEHDKKYLSSCYICYMCPKECYLSPPPAPSLPPDSKNHPMTIILILMLSVLAAAFLFLAYLTVTKYRSSYPETTLHSTSFSDDGPVLDHPIWYIRTVGLPRSTIDSILIVKYSKSIGNNDCSVCLSEFQENEMLRLLPKCSHAFHVRCIDTWLTSHKNCPVCRSPIFIDTDSDLVPTEEDQAANELVTDEAGAENQLAGILTFKLDSINRIPRGLSDLGDRGVRLNLDSERRSVSVDFSSEGCSDVNMGGKRKNSRSMEGVS